MPDKLPIIDFADFGDGTTPESLGVAKRLLEACQDVGFAYLINIGIPQSQVDDIFTWSRKFFTLPPAIKQLAPHPKEAWKHRGFSGIGVEQISHDVFDPDELALIRKQAPDFKESFDIGRADSPHVENVWLPEEQLPGFREAALSFFCTCRSFQVNKLMKALGLGLGLGADFLENYHRDGDNHLRLLYYPAAPAETFFRGEKGRAKAHTDFATATILFQDEESGLEVESPHGSGQFIPVPPIRGAVVFNVGDLLMRWSNDTLKSTLHRVCPPHDQTGMVKERYSIPFFICADVNALVDYLPGCWSADRPKKYEAVTAASYMNMRINANYA
ncbi:flavonol synthase/flavanone 3-hydroxylase [Scleroderma citrinum]